MTYSKSQTIILWTVTFMFIGAWLGGIPADAQVFGLYIIWAPFAGACAFYLMWGLGFFKRERMNAQAAMPQEETRAEAWKRKLEEGERRAREENGMDNKVVIRLFDNKLQEESKIILHQSGKIEVEGNPPEDVIKAARDMQGAIQIFGVEAIAQQVQDYIKETYNTEDE